MYLLFLTSMFIAAAPLNATAMSLHTTADTVHVLGQQVPASAHGPQPVAGWDMIKRRFSYPKKAKQLRLGCAINARAVLDSGGMIRLIRVTGLDVDSVFLNSVDQALTSTAWSPYRKAGSAIDFHIAYIPLAPGQPLALVLERKPIRVSVTTRRDSQGVFRSTTHQVTTPDSTYFVLSPTAHAGMTSATSPRPLVGWDSLRNAFCMLRVSLSAGYDRLVLASASFDTVGTISRFNLKPKDPEFAQLVYTMFHSVQWSPARRNGQVVESQLFLPIFFFTKGHDSTLRLIVEAR